MVSVLICLFGPSQPTRDLGVSITELALTRNGRTIPGIEFPGIRLGQYHSRWMISMPRLTLHQVVDVFS